VSKLVLYGTFARVQWAPDYEIGIDPTSTERFVRNLRERWGTGRGLRSFVGGEAGPDVLAQMARYERASCTPGMVAEIMTRNVEIDIRSILPTINVPTLVLHRSGDPIALPAWGRYLADNIDGARYVELPGDFHAAGDVSQASIPSEVREFLGADLRAPDIDRVLATVLFTDIVSSTQRDAELGDRRWRELLDQHDRLAHTSIERFAGRMVKTTGDGLLATFDGPARAIHCAESLRSSVAPLGLKIRAGVHTGEIERRGEDVTGLGVVIARRVCDLATEGEVLASRTVKDLVTGSGIAFAERGSHALKGVPEDWQLYAVS
jgi:class 3 adenylate cyclase